MLPNASTPEIRQLAEGLENAIASHARNVADATSLTLDGEVATYYLNDTLITHLPQLAGSLSQTRLKAAYIAEVQMIDAVAGNAGEVNQVARRSYDQTLQGQDSLTAMLRAIGVADGAVKEIATTVDQFVKATLEICQMTAQVRDIAEQTNLLALQQSTGQAQEVARALTEAGDSVRRTTDGVDLITGAVNEQMASSRRITGNVGEIADMAARNNQAVARAAGLARQLENLSDNVMQEIGRFQA